MSAKANTPAGDQLDVLTTLVEAYKRAHFPMAFAARGSGGNRRTEL
jgi:hypothetical protein